MSTLNNSGIFRTYVFIYYLDYCLILLLEHLWLDRFDQHGAVDVSSQLNYILELTKQPTLSYVGHSQGTLTFFIAMETNPELNSKINQMYALAPVTTVANARSPIRLIAPYADDVEVIKMEPLKNYYIFEKH